jgi:type I restriction enzyme M protein
MSVRNTVKSIQDIMRQDTGVDGDAQRISQLCWMFFLKIIDDQDKQLELMQADYKSPIPKPLRWRNWAADPEGITGEELMAFVNTQLFPQLKELNVAGKQADRRRVVRDVFEDAYNYMKSGQLMRQVVNKINEVDFNNLSERQHFGDIYEQILNDLQSAGNAGEYYTPRAVTAFMVDRIDPKPGEILLDPACGTGGFLTCALRHMRQHYVKTVEQEQLMQAGLRAVEKKQLPHMLGVTNMLLHGIENPSFVRHDNTLARPYISYGAADRVDIVLTNPPFGGREEDGIESNFPQHFRTKETADLFLALIIRLLKPGGRAAVVLPDGSLFGEGVKTRLKQALLEECNLHTIVRLPNSVFKPYASIGTNLLFFEKGVPTKEIWYYEHRIPDSQKAYSMTKPIRIDHFKRCIEWWGGVERKGREANELAWLVTIDQVRTRSYNLDFKNPHTVEDEHGDAAELLAQLQGSESKMNNLREQFRAVLGDALSGMNGELLLKNFDRISNAPNAVQYLRQFILDLAVRGRLLKQDPRDEPASLLMKQIQAEKAKRVLAGQMKDSRFDLVGPDEQWFEVPSGWSWVRLGEITQVLMGQSPPGDTYNKRREGIPLINGPVEFTEGPFGRTVINQYTTAPTNICEEGDLLLCVRGSTTGRTNIAGFKACIGRGVAAIRPFYADHYVRLYVWRLRASILAMGRGIAFPSISRQQILDLSVPLPPLAEQHRIVAKVDELMELCDRLDEQLSCMQTQSSNLLNAVLHEALAATPVEVQ